jgi:hypothetical protein
LPYEYWHITPIFTIQNASSFRKGNSVGVGKDINWRIVVLSSNGGLLFFYQESSMQTQFSTKTPLLNGIDINQSKPL